MCAGHAWSNGVSMLSPFLEFVVRLWYSSDIVVFISSFYRPTTTPTTPPPPLSPKKEEFEYTKEVIRIRILKKKRQPNGQKKKDIQHLQNIHIKLKIEKQEPH